MGRVSNISMTASGTGGGGDPNNDKEPSLDDLVHICHIVSKSELYNLAFGEDHDLYP